MQDARFGAAPILSPRPEPIPDGWTTPGLKEIPYDHVAAFTLAGTKRGNRVEDVINISVDGAFIATSIGYSFLPAAPSPPTGSSTTTITRLSTNWTQRLLSDLFNTDDELRAIVRSLAARLFGVDFTYSIIDSGTGRELQNRSIHNLAGLGSPDGRRPFRPMAKPMLFQPRSTIRVVVDEFSVGPLYVNAQLFIVLHGYKILGAGF